jgi:hypothetical protein
MLPSHPSVFRIARIALSSLTIFPPAIVSSGVSYGDQDRRIITIKGGSARSCEGAVMEQASHANHRALLRAVIERLSEVERTTIELRLLLETHLPCLEQAQPEAEVANTLLRAYPAELLPADSHRWEVTSLGRFQLHCAGVLIPPCKSRRALSLLLPADSHRFARL